MVEELKEGFSLFCVRMEKLNLVMLEYLTDDDTTETDDHPAADDPTLEFKSP